MAVFRVHKSKDFTVMSNHHLRNKELSLKAKGLLTLMLSLPEDWDYSVLGLASLSKDGKDSVMSALDELVKNKYLSMTMGRDNKGHITGWDYDVYETPQSEKPSSEKPYAENPNTENPLQYNTNIDSIKEQSTKEVKDNYSSSRTINSTSNKNNISSTLPKKEKKGLDLSFVSTEYIQAFGEWLNYKRSIKDMYKTQRGVEGAYRDLLAACNNSPADAINVVNYCIDKEYRGIYAPKQLNQQSHGSNNQKPRNRFCEFAETITRAGGIL